MVEVKIKQGREHLDGDWSTEFDGEKEPSAHCEYGMDTAHQQINDVRRCCFVNEATLKVFTYSNPLVPLSIRILH
jgi:hypothetical protein